MRNLKTVILFSAVFIVFSSLIRERNFVPILVKNDNTVFFKGTEIELNKLCDTSKVFIDNPYNSPYLHKKRLDTIEFFGEIYTSRVLVSLACERETQYEVYLSVQNEIERAYNEIRNELALEHFRKNYNQLSVEKQKSIDKIYPKIISEAEPMWWYQERGINPNIFWF